MAGALLVVVMMVQLKFGNVGNGHVEPLNLNIVDQIRHNSNNHLNPGFSANYHH